VPISPFNPMALKSMKSSGYELKDALCELIDNSLWHGDAENVNIELSWDEKTSKSSRPHLKEIFVTDDGNGMDITTLSEAVRIGSSSTYDSTENFGRFGYGMISGALTQCNVVEIYTKKESGNWNYIPYDFSKVAQGELIPDPVEQEPPKKYTSIIKNSGTIVIWSIFDGADSFDDDWDIINSRGRRGGDLGNLYWELCRIFRKSVGEQIVTEDSSKKGVPSIIDENNDLRSITLNGKKLISFDPLYMLKNLGFNDDPPVHHVYDELILDVPVHPSDIQRAGKTVDQIHVRMTILNETWRQQTENNQNPREKEMQQRMIHKNAGISVLRNGREVSYERIPGVSPAFKTQDRYWSCEIDFPPTLDKRFGIRNVKIGINLDKELREQLKLVLQGPIGDALRVINQAFKKTKSESAKEANKGPHTEAEKRFKDTETGTKPKTGMLTEEEIKQQQEALVARFEKFGETIDREKFGEIGINFLDDTHMSENGPFLEVKKNLGNNVVIYNLQHPFFVHLDEIYKKLESLSEIQEIENLLGRALTEEEMEVRKQWKQQVANTRYLIDLLLGSFASANGDLDHDAKQIVGSSMNSLISRWTDNLFTVANDRNFGRRINIED